MGKSRLLGWLLGLTALFGLVIFGAVFIFLQPSKSGSANPVPLPEVGALSPSFSLRTIQGEGQTVEQFRGKPVIISFWATWCTPCKEELPVLEALYQRFSADGLVLLGINHKGTLAEVSQFSRTHNLTFPLLLDLDGAVTNSFGVNAFPTTLFIDSQGYVTHVQVGALENHELEQYVQAILIKQEVTAAVISSVTPTRLPTSTPAAPLTLEGCVTASVLNGRAGPGKDFSVEMGFARERCLTFDGRSSDSRWLRLLTPAAQDGRPLWVSVDFINLNGDINVLPPVQ